MRSINFENCKQTLLFCLHIKTIFTFIKLKTAALGFCIFMQFWVAGGRGTETPVLLWFASIPYNYLWIGCGILKLYN